MNRFLEKMYNNVLIQILPTLSKKEMTRFREFVHSPYYNKHEEVRELVCYLWRLYPGYDEKNCDRRRIFRELFPKKKHDQPRLAILFTYTIRLLQQFLAVENAAEYEVDQHLNLLQQLRLRQQHIFYEKTLAKAEMMLEESMARDSAHFQKRFLLATEADAYYTETQSRKHDHSIQLRQNNLDRFYLAEKLRDACEMHVRSQILKVDYSTRLFEAVLKEVEENLSTYTAIPAIYIYYLLFKMLKESGHKYYYEALNQLRLVEKAFETEEQKTLYNYFQNYCIHQINNGEEEFLKEIFQLYKWQLEQGLMIEEGYLSEWHYKNIVTTGIRLEEMAWVRKFIEDFRKKLDPEVAENAYRFNLASYFYASQQFDKVLELLLRVEYSDLRYSLGAKALLLRTYYDLEEYEPLFSLCDSFRQYLQRNKLMADSRRQGYSNLFKLTKRTAIVRSNLGFTKTDKLQKELLKLESEAQLATIFNKPWLLSKIAELKKRNQ